MIRRYYPDGQEAKPGDYITVGNRKTRYQVQYVGVNGLGYEDAPGTEGGDISERACALVERGTLKVRPSRVCSVCTGTGIEKRHPDTRLDLEPIKARADAATPGPWHRRKVARFDDDGRHVDASNACIAATFTYNGEVEDTSEQAERDAEFIAHARADVPALVAEVERLRAALASQPTDAEIEASTMGYIIK